jgi:hypothetical protein
MSISYVENGDSGLVARTLINQAIEGVNNGTLPYTGSAQITGSLIIDGTTTSPLGFTGSLLGNVTGNVTGILTGTVNGNVKGNALTATTASYIKTAEGAISASYATTASYALNGGGGGSTDTGSLLMTASVVSNTITFTKGNGTTFPITVAGGGGSSFPYTGSAIISGSLAVTGPLTLTNANISNDGLLYYDGSNGVVNNSEFTVVASTITGGSNGTIDLSNMGIVGGKGLVIPKNAPAGPLPGSMYFEQGANKLWIFDGGQWVSTMLMP